MKRLSWISPSNFVDVDLPIIAELQNNVKIFWQVLSFGKTSQELVDLINSKIYSKNIVVEYIDLPHRFYDLRTMWAYCKVLRNARKYNPNIYYTSLQAAPFGPLIYPLLLPLNKTVAACHNVSTPKGANQELYAKIFTSLHLRTFKNIQVFSDSQKEILYKKFPNKNVLNTPLALKDYGEIKAERQFNEKEIVFLFFGKILGYKRVDILIKASQALYEKGYHNFKVKIAGGCKNWDEYERLIKYPNLFETKIGYIPNDSIAELFGSCDFFVMPYQDIAQSGAIMVAYRYNLPIILSDLPQFLPFGIDGETGFFFKKESSEDLGNVMIKILKGGNSLNSHLRNGLSQFVKERFSTEIIAAKYMNYFDRL